ncbi:seed lectin-like [Tasmannia lanceolata]|uniref:seed lectin-like n=1 Tax=Tasmannia lanceolata TaxID=3420 RepID=UPI004064743B
MALNFSRTHFKSSKLMFPLYQSSFIFFFVFLLPFGEPISFNFTEFGPNTQNITYQGDAFSSNQVIQLTKNQRDMPLNGSVGRAIYSDPVRIWDSSTQRVTDFTTHFSFTINALSSSNYGDGLAFFLAPSGSVIPPDSAGGLLGLVASNSTPIESAPQIIAVEFDSFRNRWDPSSDHVGINVNSIVSVANVTWNSSIKDGRRANAWVSYNSSTKNLSVFLSYAENPVFSRNSSLSHVVNLSEILPEWVDVGFSASTGTFVEIHNIISWDFESNLEVGGGGKKKKNGLVVGLIAGFGVLFGGLGLVWFVLWKRRMGRGIKEDDLGFDVAMDDEFEKGTGPKRFSYNELVSATNNFFEDGKLGEGGFGGVYKGFLKDLKLYVAVKKVSKGSKQGKKEYVSEVKIISRLRHRNLVQLIGWCHESGEFLLVYEFMPNGSK